MAEFKDKVVIITGASSGIGANTALQFAKHGAKLVLAGRNEENLNKTAKNCQEQGLPMEKILLIIGDVTIEDDCNRLVDQAVDKFGQLDILVNNAGNVVPGNMETLSAADMDHMFNTNVRSVFIICKRAIPHLTKTKGFIVNVGSLFGSRPACFATAYSVSKAAVHQLTANMAQELAPKGINVNCVAPGTIKTNILLRPGGRFADTPERAEELWQGLAETVYPMKRVGMPEDVAGTILFLSSEAASFITGAVIPIDGGRQATMKTSSLETGESK